MQQDLNKRKNKARGGIQVIFERVKVKVALPWSLKLLLFLILPLKLAGNTIF